MAQIPGAAELIELCSRLFGDDRTELATRLDGVRHRLDDVIDVCDMFEEAVDLPVEGACRLSPAATAALKRGRGELLASGLAGADLGVPAFYFDVPLATQAWHVKDWAEELPAALGGSARFLDIHTSLLAPVFAVHAYEVTLEPPSKRALADGDLTPDECRWIDAVVASLVAKDHRRVTPAELSTPVPGAWTAKKPLGGATLFDCLFGTPSFE